MRLIVFLFGLIIFHAGVCQEDTLVYATGKIVSVATKEPVVARVTYESLPYGSHAGMLNGSEYRFAFFDREKYSIVVEAPGYNKAKFLLDPATARERVVTLDIELVRTEVVASAPPAADAPSRPRTHELHVGNIIPLPNLTFQPRSTIIDKTSYQELDEILKILRNNPRLVIQLEGHTDLQGNPQQLMKLSEDRVEAVRKYLIDKGVSKSQVKTKAFGGTRPLSTENTEAARALNRRVEVRILEN